MKLIIGFLLLINSSFAKEGFYEKKPWERKRREGLDPVIDLWNLLKASWEKSLWIQSMPWKRTWPSMWARLYKMVWRIVNFQYHISYDISTYSMQRTVSLSFSPLKITTQRTRKSCMPLLYKMYWSSRLLLLNENKVDVNSKSASIINTN